MAKGNPVVWGNEEKKRKKQERRRSIWEENGRHVD
jgi:hypothetical protein